MQRTRYQTVKYHSEAWGLLVELGWITVSVDGAGIALMLNEIPYNHAYN